MSQVLIPVWWFSLDLESPRGFRLRRSRLALLDTAREAPKTRVLMEFSDRLRRLVSCDCPVGMGRALGRAIAHEIGHSLKYEPLHSRRRLMRAEISRLRWSAAHRNDFYIDLRDAEAIRARLER